MRGFDRSISPPPLPPLVFPHIARESVKSSQVSMDIICCYPEVMVARRACGPPQRVSLSGSSFLSSTLFTLFTEAGCRDRGGPGAGSPVPFLPGTLSAKRCLKRRHCSSVHADGVHVSLAVMRSGSKNLKAGSKLLACLFIALVKTV